MDRHTQSHYRTGRLQKCNCTGPPYPYELEGPVSKTALDATVLRAVFRKHNSDVRNKTVIDNGSWDLPLNYEELSPPPEDLTQRLPMEILDQILTTVYNATQTSNDICICSRRNTPYKTIRTRSLKHRVTDSFALRLTCSRWHEWALKYILSGVVEGEFIELDVSNYSLFHNMQLPDGGLGMRLAQDFPYLGQMGITLYLGNPGETSNLVLVKKMLNQAREYGGEGYRIFSGVSFWDLDYIVKDTPPRWEWNVDSLILLDILSYFSGLQIQTRVQFPTTIFATLPQRLWEPVLKGLLCQTDKISFREFQVKLVPVRQRYRNRGGLPLDPIGSHAGLLGGTGPDSITRRCKQLHNAVFLGPKQDWKQIRHLNLNLKSFHEKQVWRVDDAFLGKFSPCDLDRLVSVTVDGGLASRLSIDGLLKLLEPSSNTIQKLIFRPADGDPGIGVRYPKHHCQILSPSNMERQFPRLGEIELYIPCCPDIFLSDGCQPPSLKRRWRIRIPRKSNGFMGFCQNWINRNVLPDSVIATNTWRWDYTVLSLLFEAARIGRSHLLSGEMKQVKELQGQVSSACKGGLNLDIGDKLGARVSATNTVWKQRLENKFAEISNMWQVEIRMKNVSIPSYTDTGVETGLVFCPLVLPQPKVRVRTTRFVVGARVSCKKVVKREVKEKDFLKDIEGNHVTV